jgi:L-glyceraldehyde 3-phosphate reductase
LAALRGLKELARERGQTMAQMALCWVLRHQAVTSALIGASSAAQIKDCAALDWAANFTREELERIDKLLGAM